MPRHSRTTATTLLVAAMVFVSAACGSTVDGADRAALDADGSRAGGSGSEFTVGGGSGTAADGGGASDPATGPGSGTPADAPTGGVGGGPAADPTASGGANPGSSGTGTAPGEGGGSAPAPGGQVGPGVTDTTIRIGLTYDRSAGALNQAYGFAGIGQVDQKRALDLLIEHINDNGGVAGRKLEAVYYVQDSLANKTPDQVAQESCATWTQDTKVFAAWVGGSVPARNACLTKAGVVQVGTSFGRAYSETFKQFPYLVDIGAPSLETLGRVVVDQLAAAGFYRKARPEAVGQPIKLGLMAHDEPEFRAGARALKAALAEHGLKLSAEVYVTKAETANDIPLEANAVQAAVLRFKEQGITHVQFLQTNNGFAGLTFWQNAERLAYYPRYGLTSSDGAQALIATVESAGGPGTVKRQLSMSLGVGWTPLFDVPRADYTGSKESAELRRCKQVLEPASSGGWNDAARNKEFIAANLCDAAFYFKAAVEAGGAVLNPQGWLAGVAKIDQLGSALSFSFRTTRQRDAVGAVRPFAFADDCTCFHYTSGPKPI